MGGISVGGGGGGRRSVDSQINMIPMIDLLVCTISFLLITAVWSHMARVDTHAQVPGDPGPNPPQPEKFLHVTAKGDDHFTLSWRQGATVIATADVPRHALELEGGATVRYGELAEKVAEEWRTNGAHRDASDRKLDQAVVHAGDKMPFRELVGVLDAIKAPKRELAGERGVPAFAVSFAVD